MVKDTRWKEIASVYIGTVIGAGFASGQEILQFFINYGYKGILGAIVSTILFMTIGAAVLLKMHNDKLDSYQQLIRPIMGRSLSNVAEFVILSYLFIGVCVMVAGSGALFSEQLNMPYNMGIIIMVALTLATVLYSVEGILKVNKILIPILLFGIISISLIVMLKKNFAFNDINIDVINNKNWIQSAVMYVSYNIISAFVVLSSLRSVVKSKKTAIKGGMMGGLGLGTLSIFIIIPILLLFKEVNTLEIPMLGVARYVNKRVVILYSILIWIAMFTTSVSNSFGFLRRICDIININFRLSAIVFCIVTIPVAKMGFSKLVNVFYPLFGYLSLILMFLFIIMGTYRKITKVFPRKRGGKYGAKNKRR